jgi:hypothetical protein
MSPAPFARFFEATPPDLLDKKLYSTVAVPLYTHSELRAVSMQHLLKAMGASHDSTIAVSLLWPPLLCDLYL